MKPTVYTTGTPADREEIVDFANYVFSQAHVPHDFKTLLPKTYADNARGIEAWHFLAKQEGRIRALICDRPLRLRLLDRTLSVGCVGTVSVHLYSRGEGHMKRLMADMIADARAKNYDLLMLGGQRQRYNYFGFEQAGWAFRYAVDQTNLRHCMGDVAVDDIAFSELTEARPDEVDFACALAAALPVAGERPRGEFLDIMHSWHSRCRLVRIGGKMAGYVMGSGAEIALCDEDEFPRVVKALFREDGLTSVDLSCGPHQTGRMKTLSRICGGRTISTVKMLNVLNWRNVLGATLGLRASFRPLEDGRFTIAVDGQPSLTIRVEGGAPSVAEEGAAPDLALPHLEMERALFGLEALATGGVYKNWFPLPFFITPADTF